MSLDIRVIYNDALCIGPISGIKYDVPNVFDIRDVLMSDRAPGVRQQSWRSTYDLLLVIALPVNGLTHAGSVPGANSTG